MAKIHLVSMGSWVPLVPVPTGGGRDRPLKVILCFLSVHGFLPRVAATRGGPVSLILSHCGLYKPLDRNRYTGHIVVLVQCRPVEVEAVAVVFAQLPEARLESGVHGTPP